ncbi:hypothetical protein V6V47_27510 [Micromonospora sp. CPCC 205539]
MKAHRTDLLSFAFGLVFLGLSAWWLLAQLLGLALPPVGWFLAGALILIGIFGLVGALRSGRPGQPEPTATVAGAEPVAPTSGAGLPTPTASMPASTASLPVWEGERSTVDAFPPRPAPEAPTTEMPTSSAPDTEQIHPAWLAHQPSDADTTATAGQPVGVEADESTRVVHPVEPATDQPTVEREDRREP